MSIEFLSPEMDDLAPRIAVIGVGGAGGNAIANMMRADVQGVDFLVANTDAQALKQSTAPQRIQLGTKITQGLGAGSRPEIGRAAAEETIDQLAKLLEGAHMCFITAGMGGGTGTGAAPVIAKAARDMGILTVGVVTKPFAFEGNRRAKSAESGIEELQKHVDTLIVIPNQNLFLIADANTTFKEAFTMADEVLQQGVRSITDLMVMPGLINLDFADVRSVMQEMGMAMMGTGEASGDNRALEAAQKAISNPLLEGVSMRGAKGVIISITGGDDMRLLEVDEAANHIRDLVDPDANIIWGSAFNQELEGKIRVSVVATGIDADARPPEAPEPPRSFSFGSRKTDENKSFRPSEPVATPAASSAEDEPLVLNASSEVEPLSSKSNDELVLSTETIVPQASPAPIVPAQRTYGDEPYGRGPIARPAPASSVPPARAPVATAIPVPTPAADEGGARRHWLAPGAEAAPEGVPAAPRVKLGGTLFERMSNAARGGTKEDGVDGVDLPVPRFLHRSIDE
ncbi:cell division protein FtsZ [Sphingomonas sp. UV9]|uniref:cell division protein FtsZ n=1 Tax=Sphingomonas sp. UV9 TaxID=1851410 RepID=UPI000FFBBC0A|nr:cell division protein FtsZ [Sphingomonas sp. UV9]RXD02525.1 cell division protein FtsZ [Sphingomonas sp. UV9]